MNEILKQLSKVIELRGKTQQDFIYGSLPVFNANETVYEINVRQFKSIEVITNWMDAYSKLVVQNIDEKNCIMHYCFLPPEDYEWLKSNMQSISDMVLIEAGAGAHTIAEYIKKSTCGSVDLTVEKPKEESSKYIAFNDDNDTVKRLIGIDKILKDETSYLGTTTYLIQICSNKEIERIRYKERLKDRDEDHEKLKKALLKL